MTEDTLQSTLDFCARTLAPLNPEMHARVAKRYPHLMSIDEPSLDPNALAEMLGDDEEAKEVMKEKLIRKRLSRHLRSNPPCWRLTLVLHLGNHEAVRKFFSVSHLVSLVFLTQSTTQSHIRYLFQKIYHPRFEVVP